MGERNEETNLSETCTGKENKKIGMCTISCVGCPLCPAAIPSCMLRAFIYLMVDEKFKWLLLGIVPIDLVKTIRINRDCCILFSELYIILRAALYLS